MRGVEGNDPLNRLNPCNFSNANEAALCRKKSFKNNEKQKSNFFKTFS